MQGDETEMAFNILLVEDEESDALLLKRALKRHGVNGAVQWTKDGLEALHYLEGEGEFSNRQEHPVPDMIILDLRMPRMSGLELLAWIRDRSDLRAIPTVVMSSSRSSQDIERAYALGAKNYTVKPADFGNLVKMVKAAYSSWIMELETKH